MSDPKKPPCDDFDDIVGASSQLSDLKSLLDGPLGASVRRRIALGMPRSFSPVKKNYVPITLSARGEAGQTVPVTKRNYALLKPVEVFMYDTSVRPGHATYVTSMFAGMDLIAPRDTELPSWMFYEWVPTEDKKKLEDLEKLVGTPSEGPLALAAAASLRAMNAAAKMTWPTLNVGFDMTWTVRFEETCKWEAVLWCWEIR